ncbi:unnamed protein product, partial [marine sediment metagenome]
PEEASPEEADTTIDTSEETEPQSGEAEDEA